MKSSLAACAFVVALFVAGCSATPAAAPGPAGPQGAQGVAGENTEQRDRDRDRERDKDRDRDAAQAREEQTRQDQARLDQERQDQAPSCPAGQHIIRVEGRPRCVRD